MWDTLVFHPFLNVLFVLYHIFGDNLGIAVIVLTILIRLALTPAMRKQTEMTQKMASLKPKLEELKKKYAKNQEKYAQEQMKLYKEVGYNPLGCLVSFLPQFVVLIAIYQAIQVITSSNIEGLYPFVKDFVTGGAASFVVNTSFLGIDLAKNFNQLIADCNCIPGEGIIQSILSYVLGPVRVPASIPYLVLSLAVGIVQYYSTLLMQFFQGVDPFAKKETKDKKTADMSPEEMQASMSKSMNLILPIMTVLIAVGTPAVLGLYWFAQSFALILQYVLLDRAKTGEFFKKLFGGIFGRKKSSSDNSSKEIVKGGEIVKNGKLVKKK